VLKSAWHFRRFWRPYRLPLIGGALLVVVETLAGLAEPWPLKVIVDGAINHKHQHDLMTGVIGGGELSPETILVRALVALVLLVVLVAVLDFASDYLMSGSGQRVMMDVRNALFGHLQRLSLAYHSRQRVGDLTSRLAGDIDRVQDMLVAIFDTLIPNTVMLVGLSLAMVVIDPGFGLLALTIAPLLFAVTYRYTLRIRFASRRAREAEAGITALANEALGSIQAVQAFTREEHEDERFAAQSHEAFRAGLVAIKLKAVFTPLVDVVSVVGTVIVLYFGVHRVLSGRMTLGLLLVFLSYLTALYKPMRALSKLAYLVSRGTVSADRVLEVLNTQERVPERRGARKVSQLTGAVEFRDVSFRYDQDLEPVFSNLSVRVDPGQRIGIVGPSGAGKSTFVSLIPRFYDPQGGAVLVDASDVRELELRSLRAQVSIVLQEPILFYGSILDNIRYGDRSASMKRVLEAAEAANVTEFVESLPDGLNAEIGERGTRLSGGQRQRIAIARAMLRGAPILILDEPTTGLDGASESLVLEGTRRLAEGRTTFVISHHQAPLVDVDVVLDLSTGRLQVPETEIVRLPRAQPDQHRGATLRRALSPGRNA
jgi:ATP-binding cassette subfamily B protein